MFDNPRIKDNVFQTVNGFKSDEMRDIAMTKDSMYDIVWVRPHDEDYVNKLKVDLMKKGIKYNPNRISGTEKNIIRRNNKN